MHTLVEVWTRGEGERHSAISKSQASQRATDIHTEFREMNGTLPDGEWGRVENRCKGKCGTKTGVGVACAGGKKLERSG